MKIQVYLTKEALYFLGLRDGSRETVHCFDTVFISFKIGIIIELSFFAGVKLKCSKLYNFHSSIQGSTSS